MKRITLICGILSFAGLAVAQEAPLQFYSHEDIVKPSRDAEYLNFLKKLKETYQEHNVNFQWNTFVMDDNSYLHFAPIKGFDIAGVYKSFGDAEARVGKEAWEKLWAEKGNYIESHNDFLTASLPQYAYLAPAEGENFRHVMFWLPLPGKQADVDQLMKEWLDLHKSKSSPRGYQTFRTLFGGEPGYVIVNWGKDELDWITKSKKNNELMGEDAAKLWARTMAITQKIYRKNGWFLPEVSYSYQPVAAK